jgi:hypothetical protein
MWDHHNQQVSLNTVTPAMRQEAKILNEHIIQQFKEGQVGLQPQDYHFLSKPLAHVLGYDPVTKAQWLESMDLA